MGHGKSLEEFIDRNPDVIFVSVGHGVAGMKPYEYILSEERLKVVNAVKNERVYSIDADIISRTGPRIVNATETVYECLCEFFDITEEKEGPAPAASGFEAVLAVAGLLVVTYLLRRKDF